MKLIGLIGPAGSGKGTVADILCDFSFVKVSFADVLKDVVSTIFQWDRDLLEGETKESRLFRETKDTWWSEKFGYDVTPRKMLQLMGTEAGRDVFHPDIWIHSLERRIQGMDKVVIPDVRFPNEIDFVSEMGGKTVRISRFDPEHVKRLSEVMEISDDYLIEFMSKNFPDVHYSEYAWMNKPFDYTILNDGNIKDLHEKVEYLLTKI